MELASPILGHYFTVLSVRSLTTSSTSFSASVPIRRPTVPTISLVSSAPKSTGCHLPFKKDWPRRFHFVGGVGNTTAATNESAQEHVSSGMKPNPKSMDESVLENSENIDGKEPASEQLNDHKMIRVCDKLIQVFLIDKPTPTDWRRLLIFSKEWENIRPHFFKRCETRADKENDPGKKHGLLRLARKLKEIDEDIQRHNELLGMLRDSPSQVDEIVARRRKDFTKEFFVHVHTVAESFYDNTTEQNAVAKLGNACLAAIEAHDNATESLEALNAAELKFQDIINSPTVEAACRKIDDLAEKNQLDSALVLMITKAWSAAKESNMVKDEAKDVLYHLYKTSAGNLQRLMPKEIRIVKYLLTIEDPEECLSALNDAFTPGEEIEGTDVDCLYTTPERLYNWIGIVVDAYHSSREGTLIKQARDLMNPKIIHKMELLKKTIRDKFM